MTIDWKKASRFSMPEDSAGYLLWQVTHQWQRQVDGALAEIDITHLQFVLLAGVGWLTRDGDLATQARLAEFCRIDVMQVSQVVRKLEAKYLVQRAAHPTDTRAKAIALTAMGRATLTQALPLIEDLDAAFFSSCNVEALLVELKQLHVT
jgi:DNA-binding MarR family transcriptional regulator